VVRAETEQSSFREFLVLLAAEEVAHRQQARLVRLTHRPQFPFLKTIDEFDSTAVDAAPGDAGLCARRPW